MCMMKDYLLIGALVLGMILSFIAPGIDLVSLTELNTVLFITLLFLLSSRIDLVKFSADHLKSARLMIFYLISAAFILGGFLKMVFRIPLLEAIIFSIIVCAIFYEKKNKVLSIESDMSTPLMMMIAYVLIGLVRTANYSGFSTFLQGFQFMKEVVVGLGIGVVIGLFLHLVLRKNFTKSLIVLAFVSSFVAYLISYSLEGNGFLSVIMVGLFTGHLMSAHKGAMSGFLDNVLIFVSIIAFILLGLMMKLPWQMSFFARTVMLFAILLLVRSACVAVVHKKGLKDALSSTFLPRISPAAIPLVFIFLTSMSFAFIILGFLLSAFIVYSLIVSIVAGKMMG